MTVYCADTEKYTYKLTQSSASLTLWTTTPAQKVFKDSPVPADTGSAVKVYAAKNEFEPFLLAVRPLTTQNVTVTVPNFGSGITVDLFRVDFVSITTATDVLGRTGPYPDPLYPVTNASSQTLAAGENTAFWFRVYVPASVSAGNYSSAVSIGGISVPVTLHVFNFSLPETPRVKSQMNLDHDIILKKYGVSGTGDEYWMYVDKIKQFMIDHRMTPKSPLWSGGLTSGGGPYIDYDCTNTVFDDTDGIWGFEKPAERYLDGTGLMNGEFTESFNNGGGFPSFMAVTFASNDPATDHRPDPFCGITKNGTWNTASSAYNSKWFQYMGAVQSYLNATGYLDKSYYYMANEPQDQADYDAIAWYAKELKKKAPNLKLMVSEPPKAEIYNNTSWPNAKIDIWLPVLNQFDPAESANREINHGEESWIYFLHGTRPPFFNPITIDHPGIEGKLTGWFLWKYRLRGIAYYSINNWSVNPWTSPMTYGQNGNTFLFYPPSKNNTAVAYGATNHRFVSSIRMAMLRDGFEDFEYLHELAGNLPVSGVINSADAQVNKIISGVSAYERDPEFMYNLRRLIGLKAGGEIASIPDIQPPPKHPRAEGLPGNYYINFQNPAGLPSTTRAEGLYKFVTVGGKEYYQIGTNDYDEDRGYGWYAPSDVNWKTGYDTNCTGGSSLQYSYVYSDYGRKATFEFAMPSGTYSVSASVGRYCRSYTDLHELYIEGVPFFINLKPATCHEKTLEVNVADSSLTVQMGDEANNQYTFLNYIEIAAAVIPDPEPGDLNCNGRFDLGDVLGILRTLAGHEDAIPSECPPMIGDWDQDGFIALPDAAGLMRNIAGL
ncbi:MAG: glycoside hydrolase domain-containing protein [Desulfococcaceae bacterium]